MRKILFDTNGALYNAFGMEIPLRQEDSQFYALLETEQHYSFDDVVFFVAKGFGEIGYTQLPTQKPSFGKVCIENLDYYIQHKAHSATSYDEIAQIESFVKLLEYNNDLQKPKIYTTQYNQLLNQLLGIHNERFYKI